MTASRTKQRLRGASIVVCVLVVLLIIGLVSAQTIQTLLIVRRSDRAQSNLRQANEFLELGRISLAQQPLDASTRKFDIPLGSQMGRVEIVRGETTRDEVIGYRILAKYPAGQPGEVTVTWEIDR